MVTTITPMVHGGRRNKWILSFISHLVGGALGGALALTLLAVVVHFASPSEALGLGIAGGVLLLALLFDLRIMRARLPSPRRQVPRRWREEFGPHLTAFLYGLGLGTGVTTRVYFAITYAIFIAAPLLLPLPLSAAVGAMFGLARSASVWVSHSAASHETLDKIVDRREGRRELARWLNAAANLVVLALVIVGNS